MHSSQLMCQQQPLTSLSITAVLGSVVLVFKYGGGGEQFQKPDVTVLHTSPPLNSKCKRRTISGVPKNCHCMMQCQPGRELSADQKQMDSGEHSTVAFF